MMEIPHSIPINRDFIPSESEEPSPAGRDELTEGNLPLYIGVSRRKIDKKIPPWGGTLFLFYNWADI